VSQNFTLSAISRPDPDHECIKDPKAGSVMERALLKLWGWYVPGWRWTNSSSNSKRRRFLQAAKLTGGKFIQTLGLANRTGLALLGKAWLQAAPCYGELAGSGRAGQELQGEPKAVIWAGGRHAWGFHLGKGENWQLGEGRCLRGGNRSRKGQFVS